MKTREAWIEEARAEIYNLQAAGEEVTRGVIEDEIRQNYLDPDVKMVVDAEGGVEAYIETLWAFIERELA